MNRQPVYDEDRSTHRIISMPNGMWVAQEYIGRALCNVMTDDGWRNIGRPTTREIAKRRMAAA